MALLVEGKKWIAEGLEVALLSLLQVAPDGGTQRELIRSMLGLVLSANGIQFLLDWAVEVVHLPSCPMAFGQQSLRIIERAIQRLDKGPIQSDKRVVPALQCVRQSSNFKGHHKKKAALLMARLSCKIQVRVTRKCFPREKGRSASRVYLQFHRWIHRTGKPLPHHCPRRHSFHRRHWLHCCSSMLANRCNPHSR